MYIQPMNERYYMLMMLIPLVAINLIRNLKLLAPFSQLANIITFVGLIIVLYYVFQDLPPVSTRPLFGPPVKYTMFVGTTLFALEAVGVVSRKPTSVPVRGEFQISNIDRLLTNRPNVLAAV